MKELIIHDLKKEFKDIEFIEIEITETVIKQEDVKDSFGKRIFEGNEVGYFVFIDLCTIANWSHECEYRFYKNDLEYETKVETWKPSSEIKIEKIKQS